MRPLRVRRAILTVLAVAVLAIRGVELRKAAAEKANLPFDYEVYAAVLQKYVNDQGLVHYRGLKSDGTGLDAFAAALETLDPKIYDQGTDKEKSAFWLNAYNALTLKAIVTHYPIQPAFLASLRFPKNSIRQIPGVWDQLRFGVMGRQLTLDDIEHEILRKQFNEPRIHLALVCAAMGCPPLRNEPYTGDKLEVQFGEQARRFLQNSLKFRIDRQGKRVYLSAIFKWFGADFVSTYSADRKFGGYSGAEGAVLNFVSQYLGEEERRYLVTGKYDIGYLDYDWSLNEQKGG